MQDYVKLMETEVSSFMGEALTKSNVLDENNVNEMVEESGSELGNINVKVSFAV